jgi:photosystem II stability/assembly factor-like uncharacterized protein
MKLNKPLLYINILLFIIMPIFLPCSSQADYLDNWTLAHSLTAENLYGIAFGNSTFVAVGGNGRIRFSYDYGDTWDFLYSSPPTVNSLYQIAYGDNTFIAVSNDTPGPETISLSNNNGLTWSSKDIDSPPLWGITYANGKFVAVGGGNNIYISEDKGANWSSEELETAYNLYGIAYGNSTLVAVGNQGKILTKTDGCTITNPEIDICWKPKTFGTDSLQGVAFGNVGTGRFIAVGMNGTILLSTDKGQTWTSVPSGYSDNLWGVTYGNGTFVAVGNNGIILTSPTGEAGTWQWRDSGSSERLNEVAFCTSRFIAVGSNGTILVDGPEDPVRYWSAHWSTYTSIQQAYDDWEPGQGDVIQTKAVEFNEDLTFDDPVSITLAGGYDDSYSPGNRTYTTVNGKVTISSGTVTVENIVIQ